MSVWKLDKSNWVGRLTILLEHVLMTVDWGLAKFDVLGFYEWDWFLLVECSKFLPRSLLDLRQGHACFLLTEIFLSWWWMIVVLVICEQWLQGFSCLVSKLCCLCSSRGLLKRVLAFCLLCFNFGSLGISLSGNIGRVERIFLPMCSSAEVYPFSSSVALYNKRAKYGSSVHFGDDSKAFHPLQFLFDFFHEM